MNYQPAYRGRRGFTLTELSISALILAVILAGLFLSLNIGQFSSALSIEKIKLSSDVRLAMEWINRDLRQAISWNIAATENTPSTTYLKFNLWAWNNVTRAWDLSSDYVEYSYDPVTQRLTRTAVYGAGNTLVLEFNNLIEAPFYTTYVAANDPENLLDPDALRTQRKLLVVLSSQRVYRGRILTYDIKSEVKIRNG